MFVHDQVVHTNTLLPTFAEVAMGSWKVVKFVGPCTKSWASTSLARDCIYDIEGNTLTKEQRKLANLCKTEDSHFVVWHETVTRRMLTAKIVKKRKDPPPGQASSKRRR